jgi:hypothetical protein
MGRVSLEREVFDLVFEERRRTPFEGEFRERPRCPTALESQVFRVVRIDVDVVPNPKELAGL